MVQVLRNAIIHHNENVGVDLFALLGVVVDPVDNIFLVLPDFLHYPGGIALKDLVVGDILSFHQMPQDKCVQCQFVKGTIRGNTQYPWLCRACHDMLFGPDIPSDNARIPAAKTD